MSDSTECWCGDPDAHSGRRHPDSFDSLYALEECIGNIPLPLWGFLEQGLNDEVELSNAALRAFIFDVTGRQA